MDSGLKGSEQKQSLMNSGREDSAALWMVLVIGQAEFEVVDLWTEDYSITVIQYTDLQSFRLWVSTRI